MSQEDREFLLQLGFDKEKTFGLALPVRNDYVRPLNLGIFSAYYKDGRKNEKWLLDFIKSEKNILRKPTDEKAITLHSTY